jgi:hypothetical protein
MSCREFGTGQDIWLPADTAVWEKPWGGWPAKG